MTSVLFRRFSKAINAPSPLRRFVVVSIVELSPALTRLQGMAVAQRIGARHYVECSAKTGEGVREVFQHATRAALMSNRRNKPKGPRCVVL